jgi:hypothetical protein
MLGFLVAMLLSQAWASGPQAVKVFDLVQDNPVMNVGRTTQFDHYNFDGFNGAVTTVCFKMIDNPTRRRRYQGIKANVKILAGMTVYYAGMKKEEQPSTQLTPTDQGCFSINDGEVIGTLEYKYCTPAQTGAANALRVHTKKITDGSPSRYSPWFGCISCAGSVSKNYEHRNVTAPHAKHIVAFKGLDRSQDDIGWLSSMQVYMGYGNLGSGTWNVVGSGMPGIMRPYNTSVCTVYSSSSSETDKKQWASGVENQLTESFSFFDVNTQDTLTVWSEHSGSVVKTTSHAFEETDCVYTDTPCNNTYLFQFQFTTDYRNQGKDVTSSSFYACADRPPCCLPLAYSTDPSHCDLQPEAPNFCKKSPISNVIV